MQLQNIDLEKLIAEAGGDPWAINNSLQSGRPAQISDLAQAFHNAGQCTSEASNAFAEARRRFEAAWNRENGEHPINDSAEVQRATQSLGVQAAQLPKIAVDLENVAATLAESQRTCGALISTLETQLHQIDKELGEALKLERNGHLTEQDKSALDQLITALEQQAIDDTKSTLSQLQSIRAGYSDYLKKSQANLRTDGYEPASIHGLDAPASPGRPDLEADKRQNQVDAFTQVFGRPPTSAADWETAAALDPHSYDPKYQGVGAEVRVAKIRPVPGQGMVRVSQYIEQRDVWTLPPTRDFGNNRVAEPHFDPENTKVTAYIDYENGVVVLRQNPSVEQTRHGGPARVEVGAPQASVTQTSDGAVRIKYDAGNPFAPGPSRNPPYPFHPWTVNGDLVFTPGPGGVHVDGTRTDYPSMEVYQDLPNGTTHTVLIDPAQSGRSWGPFANLPGHHDIGIGGRAFEPFDRGGWNPRYDVRVPLPPTEVGPVSNPPSVLPLTPTAAIPS